ALTDEAVGTYGDLGADDCVGLDHHARTNACTGVHARGLGDHRCRVNARPAARSGIEVVGNPCVGQIGVGHDQGVTGEIRRVVLGQLHGAGAVTGQQLAVLTIAQITRI